MAASKPITRPVQKADLCRWVADYERSAHDGAPLLLPVLEPLLDGPLGSPAALGRLADMLELMAGLAADPQTLCSTVLFVARAEGVSLNTGQGKVAGKAPAKGPGKGSSKGVKGSARKGEPAPAPTSDEPPLELPATVLRQLESLQQLQQVQAENVPRDELATSGTSAEGLRRLLLALVTDVRVVLIALSWQLVCLRGAKDDARKGARLARETMLIHAPLANRLGVWQIKWELEDLAFRFAEPEAYKRVAKQVAERRADREQFIGAFIQRLNGILNDAGLQGEVLGRPKHIYSIYRKMQRKALDIKELFDLRAVRVLVEDVPTCYSVLGLVHTHWQPIPGEFDDYITTPKGNNYQSLHTAVVGPEGKAVEVQIRTWEMNAHAELGVAAHWRYKEGGPNDPAFDRKVVVMRQLLESGDEDLDDESLLESFQSATAEDRVYVLTPDGKVIDLARGATVLDFAYHVHTQVGHRCRGAKVNGRIVNLTHRVANGDRVEILTGKEPRPSRDWLNPRLGFIHGARARAKVRQWFKKESHEEHVADGRELVEAELKRMSFDETALGEVPPRFQLKTLDDLYAAVGNGDLTVAQIAGALERLRVPETPTQAEDLVTRSPKRAPKKAAEQDSGITIQGVGKLLTTIARCCQPVPGDPVVGYVTRGRGVTVHRADCSNVLRWQGAEPHRLLDVHWGARETQRYRVGLQILAWDRRELFKDISSVMAAAEIPVRDISSHLVDGEERMDVRLQVEVRSYEQLSELLSRLGNIRNVIETRRLREI